LSKDAVKLPGASILAYFLSSCTLHIVYVQNIDTVKLFKSRSY